MPLTHRDVWDTRHVKAELVSRGMPEWEAFLYFLGITTFDWLQFTSIRFVPHTEPLSLASQVEAWFGLGITVGGAVFLFVCNLLMFLRIGQHLRELARRPSA